MGSAEKSYIIVLVTGFASLILPLGLAALSYLSSYNRRQPPGSPIPGRLQETRVQSDPQKRINFRFFTMVNSSLALVVLALILIPCVSVYKDLLRENDRWIAFRGLIGVLGVLLLLGVGLLYAGRKGDLAWSKAFMDTEKPKHE